MGKKTIYLENNKLLCLDSNGKIKRLNNSYRIHKIINDIITNGYTIVFSGNNMILKSSKDELELTDYMNLLDNKKLAFLDYDIRKNLISNGDFNVSIGNHKNKMYLEDNKLMYSDNDDVSSLDNARKIHYVLDDIIIDGYKIVLDNNDMILKSGKKELRLVDYMNLLDINDLAFLNYDILKTLSNRGHVGKKNIKYIRFLLRNVACFSLTFALIANLFPVNGKGPKDNLDEHDKLRSSIATDIDGLNDFSPYRTGEFDSIDRFYDSHSYLLDGFTDGLRNRGNSNFENENENEIVEPEPEFSDEEIEKIYSFMEYNHLTLDSFMSLIELMISEECPFGAMYTTAKDAMKALLEDELSYEIKFLVIMIREGNTYAEIDKMCAGVCGEAFGSGANYEDAYAVASSIINRTHKDSYVNKYGQRLYDQFCAPGQYEVEISGNYKKFLGQIDLEGYHAALDAFYTRESMHSYIEFRANWVQLSNYEMFVPGGNKFIAKMKDSQYVPYPDEEISLDDVKVLVLENAN